MPELQYQKQDYLRIGEQPLSGTSFVNWIRVLLENQFRIDWQFIPKALYVTSMILTLAPFRYIERKNYDKKIQQVNHIKPIFIIGHFRSGTTYLHYLLGQDPQLAYVSTFETMTPGIIIKNEHFFKNLVKNHLPSKRPMDDLEMHANLPYEEEYAIANLCPLSFYHGWYFPKNWKSYFDKYVTFKNLDDGNIEYWKKTYDYFLKKIIYKNNGKQVLLKSIVNTAKIKHILELYPEAKFIHIHRDPYKVYMSTWKLYQKILPIFSFQHIDTQTLDDYILYCYKELFSNYLNQKRLIPRENLIEFSFNEFVRDPIHTLQNLYNQFQLPPFDNAKPYFEKYAYKHRNYKTAEYQFKSSIKKRVYKHWKIMFDAYGYSQ
jgi:hypothetical protein